MTSQPNNSEKSDNPNTRMGQRAFSDIAVSERAKLALGSRTQSWLASETGISEKTLSDQMRKGIAKSEAAVRIARALGVSVDWLLTGIQPGTLGQDIASDIHKGVADDIQSIATKAMHDAIESGRAPYVKAIATAEIEALQSSLDLVTVQEIDLAYGLGGTFSDGPVEIQTLYFPRGWIEAITSTTPAMLTIARGRGDSMQPTIQDGDMVMIDRSQRVIREQDAIWALTIGDFAMIKRVRAGGERIRILSDNASVPPDEVFHEEINVVGRVIFIGRRL